MQQLTKDADALANCGQSRENGLPALRITCYHSVRSMRLASIQSTKGIDKMSVITAVGADTVEVRIIKIHPVFRM